MPEMSFANVVGASSTVSGTHSVTLQRLDALIRNNGRYVRYPSAHFQNVDSWSGVPLIYSESGEHPDGNAVTTGTLAPEYRSVGTITQAWIDNTGEPILVADVTITDPSIEELVNQKMISLSTGFTAQIQSAGDIDEISGPVQPNHVLLFRRGACPTCYPNDTAARFNNTTKEEEMSDDETKGLLEKLIEKFDNVVQTAGLESKPDVKSTEEAREFENVMAENAALKAELAGFKTRMEQQEKDAKWEQIKNRVPVGWLKDEQKTRTEFESDPAAFAIKILEFGNVVETKAEGKTMCGEAGPDEAFKNSMIEFGKKTGFILVGGDE